MRLSLFALLIIILGSCAITKKIDRFAKAQLLGDTALLNAHTGISVYDPMSNTYWYNYQGDKYFVPASNTKIVTCYAALKHLGDSLTGLLYQETSDTLYIYPAGDPTFLHADFEHQPVYDFLNKNKKPIVYGNSFWKTERWGNGWSWSDYTSYYMPERSPMPVYGNIVTIRNRLVDKSVVPKYFQSSILTDPSLNTSYYPLYLRRSISQNDFLVSEADSISHHTETPFVTGDSITVLLLADTLHKNIRLQKGTDFMLPVKPNIIYSQPLDSMLTRMMHRSDNFYAEQTLLMVSLKLSGTMNEKVAIDSLLRTDLAALPQPPSWADGSGLSRYNLFTPEDFVTILNKMKNEFGMDRLKKIFATGGTGTIRNYYKQDSGFIYAKTGTLTGVVAFSGFLITKKNRFLIFSILVNNHHNTATRVREVIEKFLLQIRHKL